MQINADLDLGNRLINKKSQNKLNVIFLIKRKANFIPITGKLLFILVIPNYLSFGCRFP
jgi:hypothetical protein